MTLELEAGRVTIFKNESDNEKAPLYRGELKTPGGDQFEIALWLMESAKGQKYLSGQVSEPYEQAVTVPATKPADTGDDIPF